jgi:hypothetical protein
MVERMPLIQIIPNLRHSIMQEPTEAIPAVVKLWIGSRRVNAAVFTDAVLVAEMDAPIVTELAKSHLSPSLALSVIRSEARGLLASSPIG